MFKLYSEWASTMSAAFFVASVLEDSGELKGCVFYGLASLMLAMTARWLDKDENSRAAVKKFLKSWLTKIMDAARTWWKMNNDHNGGNDD